MFEQAGNIGFYFPLCILKAMAASQSPNFPRIGNA